jgi:predicted alpha/beta hydrolase family esterase
LNGTYHPLVYTYDNLLDRIKNSTKNVTAAMLVARKDVDIEADTVKNVMFMSGHNQGRELATVIFVKDTNKSKLRS